MWAMVACNIIKPNSNTPWPMAGLQKGVHMERSSNEIRFYGLKPNKSQIRRIDHQIRKWLQNKAPLSQSSSPLPISVEEATYRVAIEREGGNCLCCHLLVQIGSQRWESHDYGKSAQDALSHALEHVTKPLSEALYVGTSDETSLINEHNEINGLCR